MKDVKVESPGNPIDEAPIRLVTWNVQGRALADATVIAERLVTLRADIACFQEVHRSQFAAIRAHSQLAHGEWWFKHWSIRYAAEGPATASRWRVSNDPWSLALAHSWRWLHYTRRIGSGPTVAHPSGPLVVWNAHLSPDGSIEPIDESWWTLSDHLPLLADLDLASVPAP